MSIRNNFVYNALKKIYYKYIAYFKYSPVWKKNYVTIKYKGYNLKFPLNKDKIINEKVFVPKYFVPGLKEMDLEIKSYLSNINLSNGNGYIVDCGGYPGNFTIYLSKLFKNVKILCFEPDPHNFSYMKKVIKINKCKNVTLINKAVYSSLGKVRFNSSEYTSKICDEGEIEILATTLDYELKKLKIDFKDVLFVKMDIEGAEIEALKGAKKLLKYGFATWAIASYHIVNNKKTYPEIIKILKKFKYKTKINCPEQHLVVIGKK